MVGVEELGFGFGLCEDDVLTDTELVCLPVGSDPTVDRCGWPLAVDECATVVSGTDVPGCGVAAGEPVTWWTGAAAAWGVAYSA
jgi:hypothetical protein